MEMMGEVSQIKSTLGGVTRSSSSDADLKLTANTLKVLEKRYLAKDEQGRVVETPAEMFARVARNIAQAEMAYGGQAEVKKAFEEFYGVFTRLEFLPNSPPS